MTARFTREGIAGVGGVGGVGATLGINALGARAGIGTRSISGITPLHIAF